MKLKLIFIAGSLFALLLFSPTSQAEDATSSDIQTDVLKREQNIKNRQEIRQSRPGGGPNLQENLIKRQENIVTRQELRDERQAARAELKSKFTAAREQFKIKIQTIKDEAKKMVVVRIDGRLSAVNQNQTARMTERLNRLTEIAGRLQEKITSLASAGLDTTGLQTSLDSADQAIQTSKSAVADQAAKEYIVTIGEEAALKNTVGTTVSQLRADLTGTHKTVIAAKQALVEVHRLIQSLGQTTEETITPSVEN